jgi:hypothetical protein
MRDASLLIEISMLLLKNFPLKIEHIKPNPPALLLTYLK